MQASSRKMKLKVTPDAGTRQRDDLKGCKRLANTKRCVICAWLNVQLNNVEVILLEIC